MKPRDEGTIILLIRIARGAVWEQLGQSGCRCTHMPMQRAVVHTRVSSHSASVGDALLLFHQCFYELSSASHQQVQALL